MGNNLNCFKRVGEEGKYLYILENCLNFIEEENMQETF